MTSPVISVDPIAAQVLLTNQERDSLLFMAQEPYRVWRPREVRAAIGMRMPTNFSRIVGSLTRYGFADRLNRQSLRITALGTAVATRVKDNRIPIADNVRHREARYPEINARVPVMRLGEVIAVEVLDDDWETRKFYQAINSAATRVDFKVKLKRINSTVWIKRVK